MIKLRAIRSGLINYFQSPEKIAFSLALIFGIVSASLVPQLSVNDEQAHFLKAYSITTGTLAGNECTFPVDILNRVGSQPNYNLGSDLDGAANYTNVKKTSCGSARGYSPIMHLPQSIGVAIGKALHGSVDLLILLGRLTNAIFYAFALYFIIRMAKIGKWAYVVVGLFPFMIHTAGSLSGDVMNSIIVMGSLAYIFNFFVQKNLISRKQIIILAAVAAVLALTKMTNIILLLPLVALPSRLFKKNTNSSLPFNLHKWIVVALCGIVAVVFVLLSHKLLGSAPLIHETVQNPLESDPLRFFYILYNTYINPMLGYGDLLLRGIVGEFSSFKYHLSTVVVFIELLLLLTVLLYNRRDEPTLKRKELSVLAIYCGVALCIFVTAITLALYSAWAILPKRLGTGAIYADGVQGRYFTAALVVLIPVATWLRHYIRIDLWSPKAIGGIVFTVTSFCLLFYIAETYLYFT